MAIRDGAIGQRRDADERKCVEFGISRVLKMRFVTRLMKSY